MNKHRDVRAPKVEPRAYGKSPGGVAQLGAHIGNHVTSTVNTNYKGEALQRGPGYNAPGMITDPVKAVGVGGGRTIYKTGSQCQTGSGGAQKPAGRDILGSYGPESK
jgi:hypothetical protein